MFCLVATTRLLQRLARSIRRRACGLVNSREQLPHSHAVPKFATFLVITFSLENERKQHTWHREHALAKKFFFENSFSPGPV